MPDTPNLRPATRDERTQSLSFALRFTGRKRLYDADETTARIIASGWSSSWSGRDMWSCTSHHWASVTRWRTWPIGLTRPRRRAGASGSASVFLGALTCRPSGHIRSVSSGAGRSRFAGSQAASPQPCGPVGLVQDRCCAMLADRGEQFVSMLLGPNASSTNGCLPGCSLPYQAPCDHATG